MPTQKNIRVYLNNNDIATKMTGYLNSTRWWSKSEDRNELCFTANTAWSTVKLKRNWTPPVVIIEYSIDGIKWITYTFDSIITLTNIWDKVWFRNGLLSSSVFSDGYHGYYSFEMTWSIAWSWNINYLLGQDPSLILPSNNCFYCLFNWCTSLTSAPELPATGLTWWCYYQMFKWCTWLITPPELPATTLSQYCYYEMFNWCTWLTSAPELPATTAVSHCYDSMFNWCTSLTTPPELPATTLAMWCYNEMFMNCTSLISAPELPATAMVSYWDYAYMFKWCTSLTSAPKLPATTLKYRSYYQMFYWCTNLVSIPALPATTLDSACYSEMFRWCTKIKLSETSTWEYQTPYRIPTTWTWTAASNSMNNMFTSTWWTFTWTPTIDTTYYTSNGIIS